MELVRLAIASDTHSFLKQVQEADKYYDEDIVILLAGDVIDGPNKGMSRALLELITAKPERFMMLNGNHELMLLGALCTNDESDRMQWIERWSKSKYSANTASDYGVEWTSTIEAADELKMVMSEMGHLAYLLSNKLYYETEELFVVHAGLHQHQSLVEQKTHLDKVRESFQEGTARLEDIPSQIDSSHLAVESAASSITDKVLVTGHMHGDIDNWTTNNGRLTADGQRVRLASRMDAGHPLHFYESWSRQIRQFHQT